MILVIDNCERRIEGFKKALGERVRYAQSFVEASLLLTLYDDATHIYLNCDGVDGERIARRLVELNLHTDAKIYIHSSNLPAAVRIYATLKPTHNVELVRYDAVVNEAQEQD